MSVAKARDDVEALSALRDRLAFEIDVADSPQILAVLSRQFMAVVAQLAEVKPIEHSRVDEIAEKYSRKLNAIRGPNTSGAAPSRRKKQSG